VLITLTVNDRFHRESVRAIIQIASLSFNSVIIIHSSLSPVISLHAASPAYKYLIRCFATLLPQAPLLCALLRR